MEVNEKVYKNLEARLEVNTMYRSKYEDLTRKYYEGNERLIEINNELKKQIRDLKASVEHKEHLLLENQIMIMARDEGEQCINTKL